MLSRKYWAFFLISSYFTKDFCYLSTTPYRLARTHSPNIPMRPLPRFLFVASLTAIFFGLTSTLFATHNLAGQITAEQSNPNNPNQYTLTLTTYTDPAPAGVDRCAADIEIYSVAFNGNVRVYTLLTVLEGIPRSNGPLMTSLPNDCNANGTPRNGIPVKGSIKENIYRVDYIFPGQGIYEFRYHDPNRLANIENIDNAQNITFFLQSILQISPPIIGGNNTPILLNRPLDDAAIGKRWTHNPGAFDPDGDSLVFYLSPSLEYVGVGIAPIPISSFLYPDDPSFGAGNSLTIDSKTGVITWEFPSRIGKFNLAFYVEEWRDGFLLGYVFRDMVIDVIDTENNPPIIETISDTCVYAGDTLRFRVRSWDPDGNDSLYFELNNGGLGNNGPFSLIGNPATFGGVVVDPVNGTSIGFSTLPVTTLNNGDNQPVDTVVGTVVWRAACDNIRKSDYQVDFYATDNKGYSSNVSLTTTLTADKAVSIRVVPPPPTDLTITKGSRTVSLSWAPTFCSDRVAGYNVYRKINGGDFSQDTVCCEVSPELAGFTLISYQTDWTNTTYLDSLDDLEDQFGREICYVVTAMYTDQVNPDLPILESCATNLVCLELVSDNLFLTNDSVSVTGLNNGEIFISWSVPVVDEFFPTPYRYRLYRANNNGFPAIEVANLAYEDTTFTDMGIDTESRGYNYRVEIFDGLDKRIPIDQTVNIGSSIYLLTEGDNNNIFLRWSEYVPWANSSYEIFRSDNGGPFLPIATVGGTGSTTHTYDDLGLNPNLEYCYFIRSTGSHNVPGVKPVLINDSQISCSFARDEEPPCPPSVEVTGDCETQVFSVKVTKADPGCAGDTDFISVKFAQRAEGPYMEVARLDYNAFGADTTVVVVGGGGQDFAGCYATTATDTLGNVSQLSEPACVDYCPALVMSNIFTPNGDGFNDVLRPVSYQDVILKEIHIFDRWGRKLYETTTNIEQLWDGSIRFSSRPAPEGVYYYYLRYEELGLSGNTPRELRGWVQLMR